MTEGNARAASRPDAAGYWWTAASLILVGALLLRLPGLSTDLWLDELWSLNRALDAERWHQLILQYRTDNNHHLNSLYLHLVGPQSNAAVYRLLALLSGIGAVALAWLLGARDSRLTGAIMATLFGSSYLMVFYASEARGYSTVVFFTLAAWICLNKHADTPRPSWAAGFAVCSIAGVMAHQTFIMFFIGAYVWYDWHQSTRHTLRAATEAAWRLFLLPAVLIGTYYVVALTGQEIGGGTPYQVATVVAQALSATSGGPLAGPGLWTAAGAMALVYVLAVWNARRLNDDRWLLYVVAGVVLPVIIVAVRQPPTLSPRYFIVPATVLLVATSTWLSRQIAHGGAAMIVAAALVAAHVSAGILHTAAGPVSRGHYREALRRIGESTTHAAITVASLDRYGGHDFRTGMVVDYYRRVIDAKDRIRYVTEEEYPSGGADWMIVETLGEPARPLVTDRFGHAFAFIDAYEAGDLSGITWYLYRRRNSDG